MSSRTSAKRELTSLQRQFDDFLSQPTLATVKKLMDDESRLNYQILHLKKWLSYLRSCIEQHSLSACVAIEAFFDLAIKNAFSCISNHKVLINPSTKELFGDYQCNSAIRLTKELQFDRSLTPQFISKLIIDALPSNRLIEKVEVAGPGFINIWISKAFVVDELRKLLVAGVKPPRVGEKHSVIIDMSSPNIAKEMHVGHLRSTIIGDSIARLLSFLGHRVLKLNHIGDWGTQFGMLIAHLQELYPRCDTTSSISDLQALYKIAKSRFDSDQEFKSRAYNAVVKLQQGDSEHTLLWKKICDTSRQEFQVIYERLGIENLIERGESFYQARMQELVNELKMQNLLQLDEGRHIIWAPGAEIPMTVVKSDGGFTYDTSDLAALLQRIHEEKADWIIYVTDLGQSVHFNCLLSTAEMIGFYRPDIHRVEHVGFGVVLGEDRKKFKTRSGETVRLIDLLDEGLERSKKRLIEKGRDKELTEIEFEIAQKAVAYGCIKYADLSHSRTNDYVFSFDKMLDDKGNTAVYLLYAYTRIRSIIRSSGFTSEELSELARTEALSFTHPAEWKLAKFLCRLPDLLLKTQNDFLIHSLCDYLYELSCIFTGFYDACYCIERNRDTGDVVQIHMHRLLLCEATARIMKCVFDILGLQTVEKM